jgi:hypothetical protein
MVELRSLEIRGDSVVGFAKAGSRTDTLQTYALADVTAFEVREKDKGRTRFLVAGLVLTAVAVGLVIWAALTPCEILCFPEE